MSDIGHKDEAQESQNKGIKSFYITTLFFLNVHYLIKNVCLPHSKYLDKCL